MSRPRVPLAYTVVSESYRYGDGVLLDLLYEGKTVFMPKMTPQQSKALSGAIRGSKVLRKRETYFEGKHGYAVWLEVEER